jgi:non-specific serine/threonine protein kinase
MVSQGLAMLFAMAIDPVRGIELCEQECRASEASGDLWVLSWAQFGLAQAHWRLGRPREATRYARLSLRGKCRFADGLGIIVAVERLAWIAGSAGDHERAAALLGAAVGGFRHFGLTAFESPYYIVPHDACEAQGRRALGDGAYETAFRHGAAFTIDEAIAFALDEEAAAAEPDPSVPVGACGPVELTRRECQVAELIADGLSNKQIAAKLLIAQRTAEAHVEHILAKLGYAKRAQIATWVTARR